MKSEAGSVDIIVRQNMMEQAQKICDCPKTYYQRSEWPDLIDTDDKLMNLVCLSYANRTDHPNAYGFSKAELIRSTQKAVKELRTAPLDAASKLKLVARIKTMFYYLLWNDTPKGKLRAIAGNFPKERNLLTANTLDRIWKEPIAVSPDMIFRSTKCPDKTAELLASFLSLKKTGTQTYAQYVSANVSSIIMLPRLGEHIRLLGDDDYLGTAEELSGTIVTDTYSEALKSPREEWEIASNIIHETAHIEFFKMFINNQLPIDQKVYIKYQEIFAYEKQLDFLKTLQHGIKAGKIQNVDPLKVSRWISTIETKLPDK